VILRVRGDVEDAVARLDQLGCTLLHRYHLLSAVAVSCPGRTALALLSEGWVERIEADQIVSAQRCNSTGRIGGPDARDA
jgi:hypothetical protein